MKKDFVKNSWGIVQDDRGRILGKCYSRSPLLASDVEVVKKFLLEIQREKLNMATEAKKDRANMVYLEGVIKTLKVREDHGAFILLDVNPDSKYIALSVFESEELCSTLKRFRVEDHLQIQGYLRAWSQKRNDTWENKTEVRITRIANKPPVRQAAQQSIDRDDDRIPF